MLQVGSDIDGLRVERFLGEGAMATVWQVQELGSGERFALKVMARATRQPVERFEREAAVQQRIVHPNVVRVHRVLAVGQHPAILMELVDGLPLDRLLSREVPDPRTAELLFLQVCDGVEAIHAMGLVHRDLKPANVMVGNLGGVRVAKVSDFGLVRVLDQVAATRLTVGDAPMGTPGYIAPEQALSGRVADTRSDIFSLGCILYRCLCGRPPFSKDLREGWESLSHGLYTPPLELVPELEPRLVSAIVACLRVDPEQRPPDVAALRRILARPRTPLAAGVGGPPELAALAGLVSDAVPPPVPTHLQSVQPGVAPPSAVAAAPVVATPSRPTAPAARGSSAPALLGAAAFVLVAGAILALGALWTVLG